MALDKLLSKRAVSEILDMHPQSIMRLVREGRFPQPLRTGDIGSAVRWRTSDVSAWILVLRSTAERARGLSGDAVCPSLGGIQTTARP